MWVVVGGRVRGFGWAGWGVHWVVVLGWLVGLLGGLGDEGMDFWGESAEWIGEMYIDIYIFREEIESGR